MIKEWVEMESRLQKDTTFALYFGNRGFFPEKLIASARERDGQGSH